MFEDKRNGLEVAVIGMSVRFPGSRNYREFWDNLKNGVESIDFYSEDELLEAGVPAEKINSAGFVDVKGGRVKSRDSFDYTFFGYTPHEARVMNPQTRILHETVWEALEDAGYNPFEYEKLIGLFAGASSSFYWEGINTLAEGDKETDDFSESQFMDKDYICSKISYALNLKGPVFHLHTACSTSLVGVHMACQSLLNGECDMALAGGVSLKSHEEYGYMYQEGMILSSDGHCRPFDKDADGFIGGEGAGIVVLKLLDDAIRDNDNIYAVIKGSAINNDGRRKESYTSPSMAGQREVIKYAHQLAGVEPDSISLVETHGTATNLGDQIEIGALKSAFNTPKQNYCALGSVKANIGHLDTAAGIAGLIKVVLALKHKEIPPMINFKAYNPRLKLEDSPFYINTENIPWKAQGGPRRAGVSSFGIGGTNAHVLLEEYISPVGKKSEDTAELVLLSARSQEGLKKSIDNLRDFIGSNTDISLSDMAHTLRVGRKGFEHRCMFLASSLETAASILANPTPGKIKFSQTTASEHNLIFMFAGLGSQYINMGNELYAKVSFFRDTIDSCYKILQEEVGVRIPHFYNSPELTSGEEIHEFVRSQYVVFILEYAMAKLLMHWGIKPTGVIGYSLGEYTAACIAGIMTVRETLEILKARGELVAKLEDSVLLSIPLPKEKTEKYLGPDISLAIDNGESSILAGTADVMTELEQQLKKERIFSFRISNSRAVHSHLALPVVDEFKKAMAAIDWKKPQFPILSNVKGEWLSDLEMACPEYWVDHLSKTVLFHQSMELLSQLDEPVLLEIGPGRDLVNLVSRYVGKKGIILNTIKSEGEDGDDYPFLLNRIGLLWNHGVEWKWDHIFLSRDRHRISLPTFPFKEQILKNELTEKGVLDALRGQMKVDESQDEEIYSISWKSSPPPPVDSLEENAAKSILVFASAHPICNDFIKLLEGSSGSISKVAYHDSFEICAGYSYLLDPENFMHYTRLLLDLEENGRIPEKIIYFWSMDNPRSNADTGAKERFRAAQTTGLFGLMLLARAIKEAGIISDIEITIVTNNLHSVTGEETLFVESSTIIGPLKVFPQEMSFLKTRNIDFSISPWEEKHIHERGARQLYQAIHLPPEDKIVAFRGEKSWIEDFDVLEKSGKTSLLKTNGVYLITGGMGEIGLQLAEAISRDYKAKLILTGRHPLDSGQMEGEKENTRIKNFQRIRSAGTEVLYLQGDVGNYKQLEEAFTIGESKFGKIDGIIHCAGIIEEKSFKTVFELNELDFEEQFQAKVYGLMNLEKLLETRQPDFCLVMSSVSTILGGMGFCAYSSANSFMDYKILSKPSTAATRWISVDWDKLSPAKTVAAIYKILTVGHLNRIVVSNVGGLKQRMARWIDLCELDESVSVIMDVSEDIRNRLSSEYAAPQGDTEKQLVKIWQGFFGITAIGIKDSFFELGGDSLKALSLLNLIRKILRKDVSLRELMNNSSIEKLADFINGKKVKEEYKPIDVLNKQEYYNVSSAQERVYFINWMDNIGLSYNIPYAITMRGNFDKCRFRDAIRALIERHESLRTSFHMVDGDIMQKVVDSVELNMEYYTAGDLEDEAIASVIHDFIRPFQLELAPLMRVGIVSRKDDLNILLFDIHHIISDGISMNILIKEVCDLYNGITLPELKVQYKDFTAWQKSLLSSEELKSQEKYWMNQFSNEFNALNLPLDYTRPLRQNFEGNRYVFEADRSLMEELHRICYRTGTTLYMVLLSALNVLLYKLTLNEDIVVGSPVAGRQHPDTENIVGIFINILCMRNQPIGDMAFEDFLLQVRENTLNAYENQDFQFEQLVKKLNLPKDLDRNPVFDVMFVLQNMGERSLILDGVSVEPYPMKNNIAQFDLKLEAMEQNNRIDFTFEYCTGLFKEETIKRFAQSYLSILKQISESIGKRICEFDVLSEWERKILDSINNTSVACIEAGNIKELFENRVKSCGSKTALFFDNIKVTYEQLNEEANQLAGLLLREGVKVGEPVALMINRSMQTIVGILGIIKAGGVYVPIDPEYPTERVAFVLRHSEARILISETELIERLGHQLNVTTIIDISGSGVILEGNINVYAREDVIRQSKDNPDVIYTNESLMYIMYTSGSTGIPKGVMVSHGNVYNYINWSIENFGLNADDNMILVTSISFDISVFEIFGALLSGATLHIIKSDVLKNPDLLIEYVSQKSISVWHSVPALMTQLMLKLSQKIATGYHGNILDMRLIMLGGEAWNVALATEIKSVFEKSAVVNMYGPTETTIWVTSYTVDDNVGSLSSLPIGKPIVNNRLLILDRYKKLCGVGVIGEIHISGLNVTKGYFKDQEKTDQTFISNNGEIMYMTGDYGYYQPDGNVGFIGRQDGMVKVRGYRIEIGEIEKAMLEIDRVVEVAVIAKKESETNNLYCYYVSDKEMDEQLLLNCLIKKLPRYMIPIRFIWMNSFPATPNGKVNRKALQDSIDQNVISNEFLAAETEFEVKLTGIWKKVLQKDRIGVTDDFFNIGGNSLLAIKLEVELEKEGFVFDEPNVFEYRTIRNFLQILEHGESKQLKSTTVANTALAANLSANKSYSHGTRKIIDGIEPFNELFYRSCYYNSLFPVIRYYDKDVACFLANDLAVYTCNELSGYKTIDVEYIEYEPLESVLEKVGVSVSSKESSDNIISDIITSINNDRTVIIWVDCYYASIREETYQKDHMMHTWLIYGYDLEKKVLYIVEHLYRDNLNYEKRVIGFSDVEQSYKGYLENSPEAHNDHSFYEFYKTPEQFENMAADNVRRCLAKNISQNKEALIRHLDAIQIFIQYLKMQVTEGDFNIDYAENLLGDLNNIVNIKKAELYKLEVVCPNNESLINLADQLLTDWKYIRSIVVKYTLVSKFGKNSVYNLLSKLEVITELEARYIDELQSI